MPEAKVPCESCPWVPRGKRLAGAGQPQDEVERVAGGGWTACREDGGTCWGGVQFAQAALRAAEAAEAEAIRPAVARGQPPERPDHRTDYLKPTTAVDFVTTGTDQEDV